MKSLPAKLRRWRKARGLSQTQAAPVLGVTLDTLQNWEQSRSTPRGLALEALLGKIGNRKSAIANPQ